MLHGGQHRVCSEGRARAAAIYPFILCKAMLQGLKNQMRVDDRLRHGAHGLQNPGDDAEVMLLNMMMQEGNKRRIGNKPDQAEEFGDGPAGQPLNAELVREARRK